MALRPPFLFRQAQFFNFFAEACTILQAPRWSRQFKQACHFSSILFLSHSRTLDTLSFPPSFLLPLKLSGTPGRNRLFSPPLLQDYNKSPWTQFFRGTTRLMSLPGGVRYFYLSYFLVVSLLLPFVSTLVFS